MAKLSQADLMSQFKEMTLVELSEFVKAFEEEFDVEIPDDAAEKIATVNDAIAYITSKKAA